MSDDVFPLRTFVINPWSCRAQWNILPQDPKNGEKSSIHMELTHLHNVEGQDDEVRLPNTAFPVWKRKLTLQERLWCNGRRFVSALLIVCLTTLLSSVL